MNNELENSEKFIYQKVGKKTGFSVSSDYFEAVETNFSVRLFEEKNTKKVAFETPLNYFNEVEDRVLEKVLVTKKEVKVISFKQKVLMMIPIAAAASILLFIGINSFNPGDSAPLTFESVTDNEIETWLESNSNSINTDNITTIFSNEELLENDFAFTNIKDASIEDYMYSNDDLTIINELY